MAKVSLMVTCLGDALFPDVGTATVRLLRRLGVEVDFPAAQTCCGQPHFNSGYHDQARDLARHGIRVNTIAPGLIDTPIYGTGEQAEARKAKLSESVVYPNRLGKAAEFASMAVEVLTNDYMNGETIRLDGAIRMQPK